MVLVRQQHQQQPSWRRTMTVFLVSSSSLLMLLGCGDFLVMAATTSSSTATSSSSSVSSLMTVGHNNNNNNEDHHHEQQQQHRNLQQALQYITTPSISYSGFVMSLDYVVKDNIRRNLMATKLYQDEDCSRILDEEQNNYLDRKVIPDLQNTGDGSGQRTMTVAITIDPNAILTSPLISGTTDPNIKIVAWCIGTRLADPTAPGVYVVEEQTPIAVAVNLNSGILQLVQDEEELYQVIVYECDIQNESTSNTDRTYGQGESIRICIKPNDIALQRGVVLKSIHSFRWNRGEVSQQVLREPEVVVNHDSTHFTCTTGAQVCSIQSKLMTDFYYAPGTVIGQGEAYIQYEFAGGNGGGITRRYLRRSVTFTTSSSQPSSTATTTKTTSNTSTNTEITTTSSSHHRKTREAGGFIGGRNFEVTVQVDPSKETFQAEVFECNDRNERRIGTEEEKVVGDIIRVCVTPNEEAMDRDVYVRQIANFQWTQVNTGIVQFAIEAGGEQASDGYTLIDCIPGSSICSFRTELKENFFNTNDPIQGRGQVYLQFGTATTLPNTRNRHRQLQQQQEEQHVLEEEGGSIIATAEKMMMTTTMMSTPNHHRQTQTSDAAYAGTSDITLPALSIKRRPQEDIGDDDKTDLEEADSWWRNTPKILRFIYIIVILVVLWILLCCCFIFLCGYGNGWFPSRNDSPKEVHTDEVVEIHYVKKGMGPGGEEEYVNNGDDEVAASEEEQYNEYDTKPKSYKDHEISESPPEEAPKSGRGFSSFVRRISSQPTTTETGIVVVNDDDDDEAHPPPRSARASFRSPGATPKSPGGVRKSVVTMNNEASPPPPRSARHSIAGAGLERRSSRSPRPAPKSPGAARKSMAGSYATSVSDDNEAIPMRSPRPKNRASTAGSKSPRPASSRRSLAAGGSAGDDGEPTTPRRNRRVSAPDTVPHSAPTRARKSVSGNARPKSPGAGVARPKSPVSGRRKSTADRAPMTTGSKPRASTSGLPRNGLPDVPF